MKTANIVNKLSEQNVNLSNAKYFLEQLHKSFGFTASEIAAHTQISLSNIRELLNKKTEAISSLEFSSLLGFYCAASTKRCFSQLALGEIAKVNAAND